MAKDGRLAAVPAPAEFLGPLSLSLFLGKFPLVLPALRGLSLGLFVFPAALACVASLGRGCFLMGAAAVRLLDAAVRPLRTAGPDGRVFPGFRCRILAGVGYFGAVLFTLGSPCQGKRELESPSFHPLRRGRAAKASFPCLFLSGFGSHQQARYQTDCGYQEAHERYPYDVHGCFPYLVQYRWVCHPKRVRCPRVKTPMRVMMKTAIAAMPVAADAAVPIVVHRVNLFCLRSQFCILASALFE